MLRLAASYLEAASLVGALATVSIISETNLDHLPCPKRGYNSAKREGVEFKLCTITRRLLSKVAQWVMLGS
jgi:hypothetical protein